MNSALGTMETNQILKTLGLRAIKHKNYLKKMEKIGRLAEDFMHWVDTIGPAPDSMQILGFPAWSPLYLTWGFMKHF